MFLSVGNGKCDLFWYDADRDLAFYVESNLDSNTLILCFDVLQMRLPLYEPTWLPDGYEEVNDLVSSSLKKDSDYAIYSYKTNRTGLGDMTLTIAMPDGQNADNAVIYAVSNGVLSELTPISTDGSLCSVIVENPQYIVLTALQGSSGLNIYMIFAIIAAVVIIFTGVITYIFIKKKSFKNSTTEI